MTLCGAVSVGLTVNYYVRQGRYVMPGVCLSVCLSVSNFTQKLLSRLSRSDVIGVSRDVAACRMQLIVAAAESRCC